ncbi:MAG: SCO family protein [Chitinophagaceae bacterium]
MQTFFKYNIMMLAVIIMLAGCFASSHDAKDSLPYYNSADFTAQWLSKKEAAHIHCIPDFSFVNQQGEKVSQQTFNNKIMVVDFFFTSCPGICKKLTKNLSMVQKAFKDDDNVALLSHSVTPEHDSVIVLKKYATANGIIAGKWNLVTGNKASIYKIARTAYFADEDLGMQQDSTSFLHTENVLLIDKEKHIRGVYKGTLPAEINNLISDIKKLEAEE